ncbi:MAG: VanZ family protein [Saprospiraceae bacterium]|nr:VanZ family protein [Saprospiraceae bacterium]
MKSHFWFAIVWTLFTVLLSGLSGNTVSKMMVVDFFGADKLAHLGVYGILSWLWARSFAMNRSNKIAMCYALIISTFIGVSMEICQKFIFSGRSFEYDDMVANLTGSITALLIFSLVNK